MTQVEVSRESSHRTIDVVDLHVTFPSFHGPFDAVKGVSFHIDKGEVLGLIGESGSGKTVTAKSILRLNTTAHSRGGVHFQGSDLMTLPESQMRRIRGHRITWISQDPLSSLNPVFSIREQMVDAIRAKWAMTARATAKAAPRHTSKEVLAFCADLLKKVQLPDPQQVLNSYPHELSGGMRQRVLIAIALASDPQLLIADEPTTALDVSIQAQFLNILHDLVSQLDISVLYISHDLSVVAQLCDRVAVMFEGRIVELEETRRLFETPAHEYTRKLLSAINLRTKEAGVHTNTSHAPQKRNDQFGAGGAMLDAARMAAGEDAQDDSPVPILIVDSLTKSFDMRSPGFGLGRRNLFRAVDRASFTILRGETLAIVGESGSGKTTVGKCVARLLEPSSGRIIFDGTDISHLNQKDLHPVRPRVQVVFQDPRSSLDPRMTVQQIMLEPARVHPKRLGKHRLERVKELLHLVGLRPSDLSKYPHQFSGGQQQRIAIARALMLQPDLLVLDEPTSALDVTIQLQILRLLDTLQKEFDLSYVFISHDMRAVAFLADRVAVMLRGEIVETGPTREVLHNPKHVYTKALLSAVPTPDPTRPIRSLLTHLHPNWDTLESVS